MSRYLPLPMRDGETTSTGEEMQQGCTRCLRAIASHAEELRSHAGALSNPHTSLSCRLRDDGTAAEQPRRFNRGAVHSQPGISPGTSERESMKNSIQRQRHLAITTRRALAGTALGLLWLLSAPGLASAQYAFTQLDVPGSVATYADGNSVHRIVGEFDDADGTHGFVMNRGEFTQFDAPGAQDYTSINGINASGERAGIYFSGERYYGYFWSHGVVTPLDPPGSTFSLAGFLNAKGQVVGFYRTGPNGTGTRRGYIWQDGVFTPVDVPGADRKSVV